MYLCIDVGGTKTLIARLDDNGVIVEETKIATSKDYKEFLEDVSRELGNFSSREFIAGAIGVPATSIDRDKAIARKFGNLDWRDVSVAKDIEAIAGCPMFMENDAKLGGLSEAMMVKDQYQKVLYLTISTGLGFSIIDGLKIDTSAGDGGGRILLSDEDNNYVPWESVASGHALLERFGQMAKDIDDPAIWQQFSADIAEGLIRLVAIFQPEVIIIGGSVGNYFYKFADFLKKDLEGYNLPLIKMPALKGADRADQAVIYGCYDYVKQKLNNE